MMGPRMARMLRGSNLPFMARLRGTRGGGSVGPGHASPEQPGAGADQQHGPVTGHQLIEIKHVQRAQKQEGAEHYENDACDSGMIAAATQVHNARELIDGFAGGEFLSGAMSLNGHVSPPDDDEHNENRFHAAGGARTGDAHQQAPDNAVNNSFSVLAVIN